MKAAVVFPSIRNPPVVSSTLKGEEPEIGSSDESISPFRSAERSIARHLNRDAKH